MDAEWAKPSSGVLSRTSHIQNEILHIRNGAGSRLSRRLPADIKSRLPADIKIGTDRRPRDS